VNSLRCLFKSGWTIQAIGTELSPGQNIRDESCNGLDLTDSEAGWQFYGGSTLVFEVAPNSYTDVDLIGAAEILTNPLNEQITDAEAFAEIYGIDLGDFTDVNDDRIKTMIVNQEIRTKNSEWNGLTEMIDNFGGDFDIIIDDGGHSMEQQQVSLGFLFKFLKPGGIFVIEDLETSYKWGWAYNKTNTEYDTLSILKIFNNTNKIMSDFITDDEKIYLNQNIDKIFIEKGNHSEISFIYKK
jgi:hypothetical protein